MKITMKNGKTYDGYCNGKNYGGYMYISIPHGGKLMVTDAIGDTFECNKNQVKLPVADMVTPINNNPTTVEGWMRKMEMSEKNA